MSHYMSIDPFADPDEFDLSDLDDTLESFGEIGTERAIDPQAPDFTLSDLTVSATAARKGWSNKPTSSAHLLNLRRGARQVLQPLHDLVPIYLTSAYRTERLNTAIEGSKDSYHLTGQGADLKSPLMNNRQLATLLYMIRSKLPLGQVIWYDSVPDKSHLHLDWRTVPKGKAPKRQFLKAALDADGELSYSSWKPTIAQQREVADLLGRIQASMLQAQAATATAKAAAQAAIDAGSATAATARTNEDLLVVPVTDVPDSSRPTHAQRPDRPSRPAPPVSRQPMPRQTPARPAPAPQAGGGGGGLGMLALLALAAGLVIATEAR